MTICRSDNLAPYLERVAGFVFTFGAEVNILNGYVTYAGLVSCNTGD